MRTVEALALGPRLGTGGEADVYELVGEPHLAVKLYRAEREGRAEKLRAMVAFPPSTAQSTGRLAWPRELVTAADGSVRGFVMDRFDPRRFRPIHQVYNPLTRRAVAPAFDTRYLMRAARNLAATVAEVHAAGAVVGDLNESNVLVDACGNVALVDCDSFQVSDHEGAIYSCPVGKPEFTPPELHGVALADGARHSSADVFALAVLVSLLLREGRHPFAGIWTGRGDPPDLAACARRRRLPHARGALRPAPLAVGWSTLPPTLRRLGRRSLTAARWRATMRPPASSWVTALERAEASLRSCTRSTNHVSARVRGRRCPWCVLVDAGVPDPFPGPNRTGIAARPNARAEMVRRLAPARRGVGSVLAPIRQLAAAAVDAIGARAAAHLRREVPVGLSLAAAALIAPAMTVGLLALVALPLAALDVQHGWWRAFGRLPDAARAAWRHAARTAGITAALVAGTVGVLWWSPTGDEPFNRWSPVEAGQLAARLAVVATVPVVGVAALRRGRPAGHPTG